MSAQIDVSDGGAVGDADWDHERSCKWSRIAGRMRDALAKPGRKRDEQCSTPRAPASVTAALGQHTRQLLAYMPGSSRPPCGGTAPPCRRAPPVGGGCGRRRCVGNCLVGSHCTAAELQRLDSTSPHGLSPHEWDPEASKGYIKQLLCAEVIGTCHHTPPASNHSRTPGCVRELYRRQRV